MQSNQPRNRLFVLLTAAFLLGIGCSSAVYWLFVAPGNDDAQLADAVAPPPTTESNSSTQEQSSSANVSNSSEPPRSAVRGLDDILEIRSLSEQQLALHILLSELDEEQVDDLLTQSQDVYPEAHTYELQFAIVQRLARQNPSRALSRVLEMYTGYDYMRAVTNVFREWAHSDLNGAVSRARTVDLHTKGLALTAIVQERMDLAEGTLLTIARDLGNEQIAILAIAQQKIEEAIGDPEEVWYELAVRLQNDATSWETIARVATAWIEESGLSVLDQVHQSLTNGGTRQRVIRSVLNEVAQTDPFGAFSYALTIESDRYNSIALDIAGIWAKSDPRSALTAATEIEDESVSEAVIEKVVGGWADNEPEEMLEGLAALPTFLQETVSKAALSAIARDSPEKAAQLVAALDSSTLKASSAKSVVGVWSSRDHNAALEWILNEPGVEEIRNELLDSITDRLLEVDPMLALTTRLARINEQFNTGIDGREWTKEELELRVMSSLTTANLEMAIDLLPSVREGPTRLTAFQEIAERLIRNDEIDRAFNLAEQVSGSDIQSFQIALAAAWAKSEIGELLNSMDRFTSEELKSKVAFMLLDNSRYRESLSDEQISEARKYLTEEHRKALEEGDSDVLPAVFQDF